MNRVFSLNSTDCKTKGWLSPRKYGISKCQESTVQAPSLAPDLSVAQ
jgi:hypothetical protein